MSRPTLPDTASQGDTGHVADHNTIVDALSELYGEHSEGAGTPEGTVTATPGRTYADTTAGDLWVKNTGTGNTGWQSLPRVTAVDATTGRLAIGGIEMGDTLDRDVDSLIASTSASYASLMRLRRTGNVVRLGFRVSGVPAGTTLALLNLPDGYKPDSPNIWPFVVPRNASVSVAADAVWGHISVAGQLAYRTANASQFNVALTWTTGDSWPATLPGDAI